MEDLNSYLHFTEECRGNLDHRRKRVKTTSREEKEKDLEGISCLCLGSILPLAMVQFGINFPLFWCMAMYYNTT